jgi:hypothetical protein
MREREQSILVEISIEISIENNIERCLSIGENE